MASGKVSKDYRWVLIREECDAFISKEEAVKQAKRQWTATHPHHRVPYYVAEAKWYIEPKGQVEADETQLPPPHPHPLKCSASRSIPRSATAHI